MFNHVHQTVTYIQTKSSEFFFFTKKNFGVAMTVATDTFIKNFPGLNFFSFNY